MATPEPPGGELMTENLLKKLEQAELKKELELGRSLAARRSDPGFSHKDLGLSNTRAYRLMAMAACVDELEHSGLLTRDDVLRIPSKALIELMSCSEDIKRQACRCVAEGQAITAKAVKELRAEEGASSTLLPKAIRDGVIAGWIPAQKAATLAGLLDQLPDRLRLAITRPLENRASAGDMATATATARALVSAGEALSGLGVDECEPVLTEALAADQARLLADALESAAEIRAAAHKLQSARRRLSPALQTLRAECRPGAAMTDVIEALSRQEGVLDLSAWADPKPIAGTSR